MCILYEEFGDVLAIYLAKIDIFVKEFILDLFIKNKLETENYKMPSSGLFKYSKITWKNLISLYMSHGQFLGDRKLIVIPVYVMNLLTPTHGYYHLHPKDGEDNSFSLSVHTRGVP